MRSRAVVLSILLALVIRDVSASDHSGHVDVKPNEIKALPASDIAGLLAGKGMGYGKAAELNGYPGPKHVLELSKELSLTPEQQKKTQAIFAQMEAAAKKLGAELVAAEVALDHAFKNKTINESSLSEHTRKIGEIEARLRAVHLAAHLQQASVMSDVQIKQYMVLRGYEDAGAHGHGKHHHH